MGIPADRDKLQELAQFLSGHDLHCELDFRGPRSRRALEIDAAQPEGGAALAYALCWTVASIGSEGRRIQECAIELKARNAYVGLLLDDVVPPEEVRSADEVNLVARAGRGDGAAVTAAIEALKSRVGVRSAAAGRPSPLMRLVEQLAGAMRKMGNRVRTIGIITLATFLVAVFGIYANWIGSQDEICKRSLMQGFCRSIGAGHLPSSLEQSDWNAIVRGSSCEAFERHLVQYGPNGHFAGEARQRIALSKPLPTPTRMRIRLSVPYAETSAANAAEARAETLRRASREAAASCSDYAQAYEGEVRPGSFLGSEEPFCEGEPGRYLCRVRGHAQCVFLVAGELRSCPATTQ